MTDQADRERLEAFEVLLRGSFSFSLNMSDTFVSACADEETMPAGDVEPLRCRCGHDGPEYVAARREVDALRAADPSFCQGEDA